MKPNRDQLSRSLRSNWMHLAILIALCSGVCEAQNGKLSSGKLAKIDAAVSQFVASTHVPGRLEIVPEHPVGVVVLTNMEGQPAADLAKEILKSLVGAPENKS
jgi:hypothetical protein